MTDARPALRLAPAAPDDPAPVTNLARIRALTASWDEANGDEAFPRARLDALLDAGMGVAFTHLDTPAAVDMLRACLTAVGGADLSLGRVIEGHINAAQLIDAYGSAAQRRTLADDLADDRVYGVWNTGPTPGMTLVRDDDAWRLTGAKSFATGAGEIDRALVTASLPDGGRQLVVVDVAAHRDRADNHGWRVRGMKGTCSGRFDFAGLVVHDEALIGGPGDYEREPRFSAGAWRFTAVQLGAVEALVRHLRAHLVASGKGQDPVQRARFADCVVAARNANSWVARAARLAEAASADAIPFVLMTRGVVEDAGLTVMEAAARAVGTASFFEESRIDRITRDLGLYLRQPVPDQARDRAAEAWLEADRWGDEPWW